MNGMYEIRKVEPQSPIHNQIYYFIIIIYKRQLFKSSQKFQTTSFRHRKIKTSHGC